MMNDVMKDLRDLLKANVANVKTFYSGEIGVPMKLALPCLVVVGTKTKMERRTTAEDQYRFSVKIRVITDLAASQDVAGLTDRIVKSDETLRNIFEESDPVTGTPKTTTVLGCLNKQSNIRQKSWIYNFQPDINYQPALGHMSGYFYIAGELSLDLVTDIVVRTQ